MKQMLKILSVMIFLTGFSLFFQGIALAASYDIEPITNDNYNDWFPQINNSGQIVWHGYDGSDQEIYLFDPATSQITQITNTSYSDSSPQINDNGQVVWSGYDGNDSEIYLYNISMSQTKQITNNDYDDRHSRINDSGQIVWNGPSGEIFVYNPELSSTTQITNNNHIQSYPEINDNGQVVWFSSDYEIYLYDISTSQTTQITSNSSMDWYPKVNNNGKLVWWGHDGSDYEIYLYDISTSQTTQITSNSTHDGSPIINDNNQMVWRVYDGDYEIYVYDMATSFSAQITDNSCYDGYPKMNNIGQAVWHSGNTVNDYEVYTYDLAAFLKTQITENIYEDSYPQINDQGQIVWYGSDGNDNEIFLATPVLPDTTPPETSIELSGTLGDNGWYTSDVEVTLSAEDEEGGLGVNITEFSQNSGPWEEYTGSFTLSDEGTTTISYRSTDNVGNEEPAKTEVVKVDKTAPVITINIPFDGGEYLLNESIASDWTCADTVSGLVSSIGTVPSGNPIDTSSVGEHSFTVEATDTAGNHTQTTVSYYVRYDFTGFLCPLNIDNRNFLKGIPIPIRFKLKDANGDYAPNATANAFIAPVVDGVVGEEVPATPFLIPRSGNTFVYLNFFKQYLYTLKTCSLSKGTWQIRVELDDGSSKYVNVVLW